MLSLEPTELYFCLFAKDRYGLGVRCALLGARRELLELGGGRCRVAHRASASDPDCEPLMRVGSSSHAMSVILPVAFVTAFPRDRPCWLVRCGGDESTTSCTRLGSQLASSCWQHTLAEEGADTERSDVFVPVCLSMFVMCLVRRFGLATYS